MSDDRNPDPGKTPPNALFMAVVQTLIFGALLALLGFWLNLRLELYKKTLVDQSEQTKAMLINLEPIAQARRSAYLEFQTTAREVRNDLEFFYFRAVDPPTKERTSTRLHALARDMGIGPGGGGASFMTKEEALEGVKKLMNLRDKYDSVSSQAVDAAIEEFINTIVQDLKASEKETNDTVSFHNSAQKRLRDGFETLNSAIESALGFQNLPVK